LSSMTCFVSPLLVIFMPFYAKHLLTLGPGYMGVLMGASGVGSFVGSIGLLAIPHGHRAFFFFPSRRRHTMCYRDWSSDVCSSDLDARGDPEAKGSRAPRARLPGAPEST